MTKDPKKISRGEKMILFLYEYGKKQKVRIRYEDMVVGLFKKYPNDFHLKGYPEYPDSGDGMHQPLYLFKKHGYINGANKIFILTESGIDFAEKLKQKIKGLPIDTSDRLSRNVIIEISRIKLLEGFFLFVESKKEKISEGDLYAYLGVTVRTSKSIFIGRMKTIKSLIQELKKHKDEELYKKIIQYNDFILLKYKDTVDFFYNKI